MPWPEPVTLRGTHATLEPLSHAHHDGMIEAAKDGELWKLWYTSIPSPEGMTKEIDRRLDLQMKGNMLPFAVLDASGRIAGMTTYLNVDPVHKRVEIGGTWYAQRVQRTPVNTECKLMLLGHAFEKLACIAVEFRTSYINQASRRAIERLGANFDGIIRNHQRYANGTFRDTCVYSIIEAEWPAVKSHLTFQLSRRRE